MHDLEKVIKGFECCHVMVHDLGPDKTSCGICPYKDVQTEEQIDLGGIECIAVLHDDALALLKEKKPIKPILNEYGEAYCICGENVGIIPRSKNLPSIRSNYCSECGRRMKWE